VDLVAVEEDDLLAAVERVHEHDAVLVVVAVKDELEHDAALGRLDHLAHILHLKVRAVRLGHARHLGGELRRCGAARVRAWRVGGGV
jgi:hypothetical protein